MTDKKLIPFDLQKALSGDSVVTRIGEKVVNIAHFENMTDRNLIYITEGDKCVSYIYPNGMLYENGREANHDLFMAPKIKIHWLTVYRYPDTSFVIDPLPFDSKEDAESFAKEHRKEHFLQAIKIEIEE